MPNDEKESIEAILGLHLANGHHDMLNSRLLPMSRL
jgi:hypothetical protein